MRKRSQISHFHIFPIRTLAMITAGRSFNHQIEVEREEGHVLVTEGIYSIMRHPSYAGWLYWAVGTQLLLCNPISLVLYAYSAHSFFKERIPYEEGLLEDFFGAEYVNYKKRTPTLIPFIP